MNTETIIRSAIIGVSALSLALALSTVARADCDSGFEMRAINPTHQPDEEVVYFVCIAGGMYGDPDLGWSMVTCTSRDGREVRVEEENVVALRAAGVCR